MGRLVRPVPRAEGPSQASTPSKAAHFWHDPVLAPAFTPHRPPSRPQAMLARAELGGL
ncbi:hypothetical protein PspLS_08024 [Pyricularia sp. CBS 133598]|nr:hypothetical protein PspLS_08024 [Pyricularia sp. CBS 133598]